MARKSNEQSLGQVISDMLKVYRLDGKMKQLDAQAAWGEVMGPVVAKKTRDVKLRGKVLSVTIDSGVMKEEFSYAKQRIVTMMNEHLGEEVIDDVRIF